MTSSVHRVSVVVPTHNRRSLLERAITCVLAQRDVDVHLVVVDDGSTDGTEAWLRTVDDPRLEWIRHENPVGVAAARNSGLERVDSPFVAFLDDDDLWAPGKLAAQTAALDGSGCSWAVTGVVNVNPALQIIGHDVPPTSPDVYEHLLQYNHVPGGGSGVCAETDLIRSVGGFDSSFQTLADWDLWVRLGSQSPLQSVASPMVAYLVHHGMSQRSLDLETELAAFDAKHAAERERLGIRSDLGWWERWFAELDRRAGRRGSARRHALAAIRHGQWIAAADVVLGDRGLAMRDRRAVERVPPEWRSTADVWLGPWRTSMGESSR